MTITYPSDTPHWLKDVLTNAEEGTRSQLMDVAPTNENLLIARGASQLFRKIAEEVDAIGRIETQTVMEMAKEATKRGA